MKCGGGRGCPQEQNRKPPWLSTGFARKRSTSQQSRAKASKSEVCKDFSRKGQVNHRMSREAHPTKNLPEMQDDKEMARERQINLSSGSRRITLRGVFRGPALKAGSCKLRNLQKRFKATPGQKAAKPKGVAGRWRAIITVTWRCLVTTVGKQWTGNFSTRKVSRRVLCT